jgi:hypothetical protein
MVPREVVNVIALLARWRLCSCLDIVGVGWIN